MSSPTTFDFNARYRVEGWRGIAWYVLGYVVERGEDWEWSGIEIEDTSKVRACMVGDDSVHVFDVRDLVKLDDDDYCHTCGQIGCTADGRP